MTIKMTMTITPFRVPAGEKDDDVNDDDDDKDDENNVSEFQVWAGKMMMLMTTIKMTITITTFQSSRLDSFFSGNNDRSIDMRMSMAS